MCSIWHLSTAFRRCQALTIIISAMHKKFLNQSYCLYKFIFSSHIWAMIPVTWNTKSLETVLNIRQKEERRHFTRSQSPLLDRSKTKFPKTSHQNCYDMYSSILPIKYVYYAQVMLAQISDQFDAKLTLSSTKLTIICRSLLTYASSDN